MFQIYFKVKFRAFNITFGTVTDTKKFPIPAELKMFGSVAGAGRDVFTYNDHGVNIVLTLLPA